MVAVDRPNHPLSPRTLLSSRPHAAVLVGWASLLLTVAVQRSLLAAFVLLAVLFVPLERALPLRRQRRLRPQLVSDLVHLAVNRPVANLAVLGVVLAVGIPLRLLLVPASVRAGVAAQPEALQLLEAVLIGEVGGYWGHRAAHQVPLLWRFHRVHHSIEQMDFVAAARTHPLDSIAMRGPALLPIVVLGFSPVSIGGVGLLLTLIAIGVHANLRVRMPVARWAIVTPEFHHWHHATDADAIDKNFAPALPVLDVLFGTAHMPANRIPAGYGIGEAIGTEWAEHMVSPFRRATGAAAPVAGS